MLRSLKLRGAATAAVLCMTDTCLGIDPRLVKSSLGSASLLSNRESGANCPNVQPLEGSKDATVGKNVLRLIRTPFIAEGSSNYNSPLGSSQTEPAMVVPSSTKWTAKGIAQTVSTPKGASVPALPIAKQEVQFFYGPESVFTQFPQCRANEACSFTTTDTKNRHKYL